MRFGRIRWVRSDPDYLAEREPQQRCGRQIDLGVRLVVMRQLRRQDDVPRQAAVFGQIHPLRDVPVGQRSNDEPALEPRQAVHGVRPRMELSPWLIQRAEVGVTEPGNAQASQQFDQRDGVQVVNIRPGQLAVAHARHRRLLPRSPAVGQRLPVGEHARRITNNRGLPRHAAAPVNHRAEDVESALMSSSAFAHPRCNVLATAFQRWNTTSPSR